MKFVYAPTGGCWLPGDYVRLGRKLSGDKRWGCDGDPDDEGCDCERYGSDLDDAKLSRSDRILLRVISKLGPPQNFVVADLPAGTIYRLAKYETGEVVEFPETIEWSVATGGERKGKHVVRHIRRSK